MPQEDYFVVGQLSVNGTPADVRRAVQWHGIGRSSIVIEVMIVQRYTLHRLSLLRLAPVQNLLLRIIRSDLRAYVLMLKACREAIEHTMGV